MSSFVQVGRDLVEEEFAETKRVKLSVYVYYAKNVGAVMSALSVLFYLLFQVTSKSMRYRLRELVTRHYSVLLPAENIRGHNSRLPSFLLSC